MAIHTHADLPEADQPFIQLRMVHSNTTPIRQMCLLTSTLPARRQSTERIAHTQRSPLQVAPVEARLPEVTSGKRARGHREIVLLSECSVISTSLVQCSQGRTGTVDPQPAGAPGSTVSGSMLSSDVRAQGKMAQPLGISLRTGNGGGHRSGGHATVPVFAQ